MANFGVIRRLALVLLISFITWSPNSDACNAQQGEHQRHKRASITSPSNKKGKEADTSVFNVLDYGANGDGTTDDTKAFEGAWEAACEVNSSTLLVPSGFEFLLKPVSFSGSNCAPNLTFQLDGVITAPKNFSAFKKDLTKWLNFFKLSSFTIRGNGTIDGQGDIWWSDESNDYTTSESVIRMRNGKKTSTKPTALRFYRSSDVTVTGITIQNSPQCHLKFDDCTGVRVYNMSASSPAQSPNTDGIHLQNSQDVVIHHVNLACGDDCVSIQTGCSNIHIHDVNCGPGHGISIGGLGKDNTTACVSNVTVRDIALQQTMNGVRIKTWQGGSGSVQGVMFSNIQVSKVKTPISIDQYYCDKQKCTKLCSAVAISGVSYKNISGTYTKKPVDFACSDSQPCKGITVSNIKLKPAKGYKLKEPFCWNAYGEVLTDTVPTIDCLQSDVNSSYILQCTSYSC